MQNFTPIALLALLVCGCTHPGKACPAPAQSVSKQAYDLCMLRNHTDNMNSPVVRKCFDNIGRLPDSCESSVRLKRQRCHLLSSDPRFAGLSEDDCVRSFDTEGYLAKGCSYPFTRECMDQANTPSYSSSAGNGDI